MVDYRNIWKIDVEERLDAALDILSHADVEELWIQPSSSLLHVPVAKHPDEHLEKDLLNYCHMLKKTGGTRRLKRRASVRQSVVSEQIEESKAALKALKAFATGANSAQKEELNQLTEKTSPVRQALKNDWRCRMNHSVFLFCRRRQSEASLNLPRCGAHGKMAEKDWTDEQYQAFINAETKRWVDIQEEIGLDVLVHGEFERTDMVEYFGEKLRIRLYEICMGAVLRFTLRTSACHFRRCRIYRTDDGKRYCLRPIAD